ncbi:MAG TPA: hypothetical protein VFR09_01420 [Alphaproteobacteria bacterium]|nr:hypothetical protein [Alphaproteobacteria bacterium]
MRLAALIFAAFLLPTAAIAQGFAPQNSTPQAKFDQYPSFIEINSTVADGTQVSLRCGYAQVGNNITADAGYMEMTFLNESSGSYLRYQRIDNKLILTAPQQGMKGQFLLEVVEPNGSATAKSCQFNPVGDSVSNCIANKPFMTSQQATQQDQSAAQQCGDFLNKATPQLDRVTYNAQKTEVFKNSLRQKVRILEGQ